MSVIWQCDPVSLFSLKESVCYVWCDVFVRGGGRCLWHMVCGVGWVFCALSFCSLLCTNGVVQWRNHVVYNSQGPEGCAVNWCNGWLGVIWCNIIKLVQVVIITVYFTMYYLFNQLLHYSLSCWAPVYQYWRCRHHIIHNRHSPWERTDSPGHIAR